MRWTGLADGRYGSWRRRRPRGRASAPPSRWCPAADAEQWLAGATVTELARLYGSLLPVTVRGRRRRGHRRRAAVAAAPGPATRALIAYARDDVSAFDPVRRDRPGRAGGRADRRRVRAADAGEPGGPRRAPRLPQADAARRERRRAAAGVGVLRPLRGRRHRAAADREPRGALRGQPARRRPARRSATSCAAGWSGWPRPTRAGCAEFLDVHHLGVKALALHDDEMLRLVERWWPMETNVGADDARRVPRRATACSATAATVDEFRQLAAVAAAQDMALINGGYTYDAELIERLPLVDRAIADRAARAERPDHPLRRARPGAGAGAAAVPGRRRSGPLDRLGCEVVLRAFDPAGAAGAVPGQPGGGVPRRAARPPGSGSTTLWADVLDALAAHRPRRTARSWCSTTATRWSAGSARWPTRSWSARRRGAVRPGAAARPPSDPRRPTRRCSTARSSACSTGPCPGRGASRERPRTSCGALLRGGRRHAVRRGADRRWSSRCCARRRGAATTTSRFAARMQATTAYVYGGEPAKSFVTFSWCRREFDRDPSRYDQRHAAPAAVALQVHGRRRC